jgi:hypothetical protein
LNFYEKAKKALMKMTKGNIFSEKKKNKTENGTISKSFHYFT